MAQIPKGILGSFTGTVGNVCAYMRNGKKIIRRRRRKPSAPMTPKKHSNKK